MFLSQCFFCVNSIPLQYLLNLLNWKGNKSKILLSNLLLEYFNSTTYN